MFPNRQARHKQAELFGCHRVGKCLVELDVFRTIDDNAYVAGFAVRGDYQNRFAES